MSFLASITLLLGGRMNQETEVSDGGKPVQTQFLPFGYKVLRKVAAAKAVSVPVFRGSALLKLKEV